MRERFKSAFAGSWRWSSLCVIGLAACGGDSQPEDGVVSPVSASEVPIARIDEANDRPLGLLEQRFREIETDAPGFAGFYIDVANGDMVMRLVDLSRQNDVAPRALEQAELYPHLDGSLRRIRYEQATHSFTELRGFRGAMWSHLTPRDDLSYIDIDEVQNRLVIGVTTPTARTELLEIAARTGIPASGITVLLADKATPDRGRSFVPGGFSGTLRAHQDTLIGGLIVQIDNLQTCSAWIAAKSGTQKVFATASHCDEDGIFQLITSTTMAHDGVNHDAGTEWKDPAPTGQNPPFRWADVALYKVIPDSVDKHAQGWFAKTTNQVGSITFDTIPVIEVAGEQAVPIVGQEVHRVGQKTGWRKGPVVQTGVDQPNWDNSGVWVYDTDVATMTRDEGDSGAPVVVQATLPFGGVGSTWKIAGIHIGGVGTSAVFSAMWNIEQDMGGLTTTGIPRLE